MDCNFDLNSAREKIIHSLSEPFDRDAMNLLRKKMEEAENILYIMDNCGEAVFDTLLVSLHQDKTTLAVRGKPILNDITRAEVEPSGFQNIRVIDTGDFTPRNLADGILGGVHGRLSFGGPDHRKGTGQF